MNKSNSESKKLEKMRHSCEHVLHQAMVELFPGLKRAMGPATEEGFYHDFDYHGKVSEDDFPKIEKRIKEIIKKDLLFIRQEISLAEARKLFKDNQYKQEWLNEIQDKKEKAIIYWTGKPYQTGSDVDLCSGPHLESTGKIGPFKLLKIAGAYWRGDEKNKMLTRIYGTCFSTQKELDNYLWQVEEAKKRDHRKLGKELDLFSFHPEAPGDVFWHPKGLIIMHQLMKYWRKVHQRDGYQEVRTPEILTREIWNQSGHTKNYLEKMYRVLSPDAKKWDMAVKPMNCNGGMLIYKTKPKSYKEFPLKVGELGVVHRYEGSGELHGIIRPREFTQDDAHIYCTPQQVKEELKKVIDLCFEIYEACDLKINHIELSTRPEKSIGSDEVWEKAETIMKQVLKEKKVSHQINEGDGAFYGPKFDFHLQDTLGRTWQCATIQLDFAQPENFNLEYITPQGTRQRPVMIHRTIYGSLERFIGILIENCAGAFPFWLAPVQVKIIPITDHHQEYGKKILQKLLAEEIRAEIDDRSETMSAKVRDATLQKTPFMIIIGDKELKRSRFEVRGSKEMFISARTREGKDLGQMSLDQFLTKIKNKLEKKI
ncbi:threonine--tRNA ligase [Candidatus Microgenomates bacterium]|nr:threonine--tRNA ligase [Candidatus Microgenomates bacterium]